MPIQSILIIEDDRFIGEMYKSSLAKAGYTVEWIVNGAQGLAEACKTPYDLVLLDIILPGMPGTDILDSIEKHYATASTTRPPIFLLTNFEQADDARAHTEGQVERYFIKAEITPRKLLEEIASFEAERGTTGNQAAA